MKKISALSFLIFFSLAAVSIAADTPEELYREANADYVSEDYAKAVSIYEELVRMDRVSPEVFYNLGNTYFKLKKVGKAVLNYERALRLSPRDRDIRSNLKLAKSMAVDKINAPERGLVLAAALFIYDRMTVDELTAACSFFYLAVILFLIFSIFLVAKRKAFVYTAGSLGVISFVLLVFLLAKAGDENLAKTGVITAEKVDARSGPKDDYLLQFTLHEGTEVSIRSEENTSELLSQ